MDALVLLQGRELREALVTLVAKKRQRVDEMNIDLLVVGDVWMPVPNSVHKLFHFARLLPGRKGCVARRRGHLERLIRLWDGDLPRVRPILAMGALMFTQGFFVDEHAATSCGGTLEEHYRLFSFDLFFLAVYVK